MAITKQSPATITNSSGTERLASPQSTQANPNVDLSAALSGQNASFSGDVSSLGDTPTALSRPQGAPEIPADTIGTQTAVRLPAPIVSTVAQDALGATVEPSEALPTQEVAAVEQPQRPQDALVERILGNIEESRGRGDRTAEILEAERVGEKRRAVDSIQDEIRRKDAFYRRQQEDLAAGGGGLKSGALGESNTISRNRNRELADLRIQEQGALGAFNTANAIAQQKVDAEFEPLQDEINNLTAVFGLMQNDLSESEKLQAQAQITSKQTDKTFAQQSASKMHEMLFQSGAMTPERLQILNKGMEEAYTAIANGDSPEQGIASMQGALEGVVSPQVMSFQLQQAQFALQKQKYGEGLMATAVANQAKAKANRDSTKLNMEVVDDKRILGESLLEHAGKKGAVGAYGFARLTPFDIDKADRREYVSSVMQLIDGLTLNELVSAKARGATFGSLQLEEMKKIANSATKINSWLVEKDGKTVGFEISEQLMDKEVNNIIGLFERDLRNQAGSLVNAEEDALLEAALGGEAQVISGSSFFE